MTASVAARNSVAGAAARCPRARRRRVRGRARSGRVRCVQPWAYDDAWRAGSPRVAVTHRRRALQWRPRRTHTMRARTLFAAALAVPGRRAGGARLVTGRAGGAAHGDVVQHPLRHGQRRRQSLAETSRAAVRRCCVRNRPTSSVCRRPCTRRLDEIRRGGSGLRLRGRGTGRRPRGGRVRGHPVPDGAAPRRRSDTFWFSDTPAS